MNEAFDITPLLADRFKRFVAFVIDYVPIMFLTTVVFYYYFGLDMALNDVVANPDDADAYQAYLDKSAWVGRITLSVWIFYCAVMESSNYHATLGKMAMKMKVVDEFGQPLTPVRSAIRNLSKIISMIIFALGFLWILVDRKKQGWHDKIARTYVVDDLLFDRAMRAGEERSKVEEISDLE